MDKLTARQIEVIQRIGDGAQFREIALELGIKPRTVKYHLSNARERTGLETVPLVVRVCSTLSP